MALSDVALCSRALIKIGAAPITSFDDENAEGEIAGALYPQVRDALLSAYAWPELSYRKRGASYQCARCGADLYFQAG